MGGSLTGVDRRGVRSSAGAEPSGAPTKPKERVLIIGAGKVATAGLAARVDGDSTEIWFGIDLGRANGRSVASALERDLGFGVVAGGHRQWVHVAGVVDISDAGQLHAWLMAPENRLILVSVDRGQPAVCERIEGALSTDQGRRLQQPVIIVPCENHVNPAFQRLAESSLARPVVVLRACFDRRCKSIDIDDKGHLLAIAEYDAYLGIESPATFSSLSGYEDLNEVMKSIGAQVEPDIDLVILVKLLLLNGTHLIMSTRGVVSGYERLDEFLQRDPLALDFLDMTMRIFREVIENRYEYVPANFLLEKSEGFRQRMLEEEDELDRILHRLADGDGPGFVNDWRFKVEAPLGEIADEIDGVSAFLEEIGESMSEAIRMYGSR